MGLNPTRVACEVFSTDTRKAPSIQCYTHVGVGGKNIQKLKIKSIVYHLTQEFHQPMKVSAYMYTTQKN